MLLGKYHISKASLMRWNKLFDGSKKSLMDKSHRPHRPHPNSHTPEEIKKIVDLMKRNPDLALMNYSPNFAYPSVIHGTQLVSIAGSKPMVTTVSSKLNKHPINLNLTKLLNY